MSDAMHCHRVKVLIKVALLLLVAAPCLLASVLHRQSPVFQKIEITLLQEPQILLVCMAVLCGTFVLLTFHVKDLPLVSLLILAVGVSFLYARPATDAVTFLAGVTLGKGSLYALRNGSRKAENEQELHNTNYKLRIFLLGLVVLFSFSSWWQLDTSNEHYHGPRWMGLWKNPNDYGMLMAAGVLLAVGLLAASQQSRVHSPQSDGERHEDRGWRMEDREKIRGSEFGVRNWLRSFAAKIFGERTRQGCRSTRLASNAVGVNGEASLTKRGARMLPIILLVALMMMGVGLVMSYSRGAWCGTVVGLLYLANAYGKFKWRWVLLPVLTALVVIVIFWNTPDSAPWYLKRLDLSRGSVQHRVTAWRASLEMIRDHPFGVGWNNSVSTYYDNYSPPEHSASAIVTNDYLMLGTQLGIPGLAFFLMYAALRLGVGRWRAESGKRETKTIQQFGVRSSKFEIQTVCRAGAAAMLVAFWFDGGLFKLATASVFWILLELGHQDLPQTT